MARCLGPQGPTDDAMRLQMGLAPPKSHRNRAICATALPRPLDGAKHRLDQPCPKPSRAMPCVVSQGRTSAPRRQLLKGEWQEWVVKSPQPFHLNCPKAGVDVEPSAS